jgi:hypothetical protein
MPTDSSIPDPHLRPYSAFHPVTLRPGGWVPQPVHLG